MDDAACTGISLSLLANSKAHPDPAQVPGSPPRHRHRTKDKEGARQGPAAPAGHGKDATVSSFNLFFYLRKIKKKKKGSFSFLWAG